MRFNWFIVALITLMTWMLANFELTAQQGYQLPPPTVVEIIDADPEPSVSFSPDRKWRVHLDRSAMPGIEDVSRRMLRLAGMRIDPAANGPFRTSYNNGLSYIRNDDQQIRHRIELPPGGKLVTFSWSHDSSAFAYSVVTDQGTQLWAAPIGQIPVKVAEQLSTVTGGFSWMPDGKTILCRLVPENRGKEPKPSLTPSGPNVQESYGNKSPTRTYQDLLSNAHDEALFSYYATSQIALVNLKGNITKLGDPGIYTSVRPSPDGKYLLVEKIKKPFSFLMTYRSFPKSIEVWGLGGPNQAVVESRKLIADVPMAENIPIEGVRLGPRNIEWKAGDAATLIWVEALDGGDPKTKGRTS